VTRLVCLLLLLPALAAGALAVPPPPTRRVNDYAGALAPADRDRLEQKLAGWEQGSSTQIVVGVFRSLAGESLEDFSIRLAQAWRIGQKGLDNGVIFLVFLDDRKMRLEVGYGLEATLTDATSASIIRDVVAPRFREGRLADGLEAGLDAIHAAVTGTYQRPAGAARPSAPWPAAGLVVPIAFVLLALGIAGASALARDRRTRRRGWTGGGRGWMSGSPGFGGGSWGGGSSGGSSPSSDGFSGGGGSFGGGGASGGW
jgi:uncharacterized protein